MRVCAPVPVRAWFGACARTGERVDDDLSCPFTGTSSQLTVCGPRSDCCPSHSVHPSFTLPVLLLIITNQQRFTARRANVFARIQFSPDTHTHPLSVSLHTHVQPARTYAHTRRHGVAALAAIHPPLLDGLSRTYMYARPHTLPLTLASETFLPSTYIVSSTAIKRALSGPWTAGPSPPPARLHPPSDTIVVDLSLVLYHLHSTFADCSGNLAVILQLILSATSTNHLPITDTINPDTTTYHHHHHSGQTPTLFA
ncbi:uncharacterized protein K489DRAFT_260627 [Dissoconium aciculare CBS 342.82]|uniref:Uncharacterized protein n=1 Tax=Dissoconium aciculare CBS 342.82 TaxID=1314786 RepID=A0A6J3LZ42_9PEZI|nr:uncharacterized protein K489DRAFT_260627 [Dissoconium aciculare CBS 342.82]KAF1820923.1 hypothetical protein K489DRAFT_260627 [Dissoconium aciculare CBS 342.82]